MRVSDNAQRTLNQRHVDRLVANFDPDQLGTPEVSFRAGHYYIIDGQHRFHALQQWFGPGWEDQHVDCWVVEGLDEAHEAEEFLRFNDRLGVKAFQKFRVSVHAGRDAETKISKIVEAEGLHVSEQINHEGAVGCVGALMRVYQRDGADCLARSLRIAYGSFGNPGISSHVIDALGMVCARYDGALPDDEAVSTLSSARGGVGAITARAAQIQAQQRVTKPKCIAAAIVEAINRKRPRGKKLQDFFADPSAI